MFDIVGKRRWFFAFSALITIPGLVFVFLGGLKPSVDFTGGTVWQVRYASNPAPETSTPRWSSSAIPRPSSGDSATATSRSGLPPSGSCRHRRRFPASRRHPRAARPAPHRRARHAPRRPTASPTPTPIPSAGASFGADPQQHPVRQGGGAVGGSIRRARRWQAAKRDDHRAVDRRGADPVVADPDHRRRDRSS